MLKLVLEEQGINTKSVHYNSSVSSYGEPAPISSPQNSNTTVPRSDLGQVAQGDSGDDGIYL